MPVVDPVNLAVFMVQHLASNLARNAKLGHLASDRSADVVDGPAGHT
jgi:hypothetical protein